MNFEINKKKFPDFKEADGVGGFLQFLLGVIIWIFFIFLFLLLAFSKILGNDIIYCINLFKVGNFFIPLWVSILITIFFFPIALVFVIIVEIIKSIRR